MKRLALAPGEKAKTSFAPVVDDGDGLDEDGGHEVGEAEVGQDDVGGGVEEGLLLADGDEDHEVEDDAEEGKGHLHHHHPEAVRLEI